MDEAELALREREPGVVPVDTHVRIWRQMPSTCFGASCAR